MNVQYTFINITLFPGEKKMQQLFMRRYVLLWGGVNSVKIEKISKEKTYKHK